MNIGKLPFLEEGVTQLGFVVEDLEFTVKNYYEKFGVANWHFYTYCAPMVSKMTYHGNPADYTMKIALSYFGPNRVELIQHVSGESVLQDFIDKHGYGLQHFGIVVEDIEDCLAKAESAGYGVVMDGSGFGLDGDGKYAYLDTEKDFGITYELIQRPARRHEPQKIFPAE